MYIETLYYVTGNPDKFKAATELLAPYNIDLVQGVAKITEIQSASIEEIAVNKAEQAFTVLRKPLFVNDAGWHITTLNGFPGPYMKYVNNWFSAEDFLDLMKNHHNREVVLEEVIAYIDQTRTRVFTHKSVGTVLYEASGAGGAMSDRVISLTNDGVSIAQQKQQNLFSSQREQVLWTQFGQWLNVPSP